MKKIAIYLILSLVIISCKETIVEDNNRIIVVENPKEWDGVPRGDVFYEIFVRSFADSNGDGVGDLNGITSKIDYLDALGVTGLWLTPITPSPSYHGYDVTDYTAVNPDFGTLADFERLVATARAKGIKIVLDFVINHSSSEHPWFVEAQKSTTAATRDYYTFAPKADVARLCESGAISMVDDNRYVASAWHDVVGAGKTEGYRYYGAFSYVMPDFNYGRVPNLNPVYDKILDAAKFWMAKGAAGLRLDAVKHIYQNERGVENIRLLNKFYTDMNAAYPGIYMIGEVLSGMDDTAPFFGGLPALFNFDSWWKLQYALKSGVGKYYPKDMQDAMNKFKAVRADYIMGSKLSNHDEVRTIEDLGADVRKASLAAAALLTMPGQPYIYYGEEIGLRGTKDYGDEGVRDPMVWGDPSTPTWRQTYFPPKTVKEQLADKGSLLNLYKSLIKLRNTYPSLASGSLTFPDPASVPDPVMTFSRTAGSETLTVVMNCSATTTAYISASVAGRPIMSYNGAQIVQTQGTMSAALPGYSFVIIEK